MKKWRERFALMVIAIVAGPASWPLVNACWPE
jgi:hypothetical protein